VQFIPTEIPEVILLEPRIFSDSRGFLMETFQSNRFAEAGIFANFVQDNHSGSYCGSLRGLHYQIDQPQGKLVRVTLGEIFDVAVDIRRSSPTFGRWVGAYLSAENRRQIWIPVGFAHGIYILSEWAEVIYKLTDLYAPAFERSLLWNDPDLNIHWPLIDGQPPILSERDSRGKSLKEAELFE